jgi:hypothetical protein
MNPPFHPQSVFPSANFPSFHLPHTETHPWGPHPPPVIQANCALPGPTISHWGTRFCICTLIPNYSLFTVQTPLFPVVTLPFFVTFGDLLSFLANATRVTLVWGTTYHPPLTTSSISSEYPTGHLALPFDFIHFAPPLAQLIPYLVFPLTLDLIERLWPHFISDILQPREILSLSTS